jgi:hypothetical protein
LSLIAAGLSSSVSGLIASLRDIHPNELVRRINSTFSELR